MAVFEENGMYYIQASGTDYSSTILLTILADGKAYAEGIACTSKLCSGSSTGCVPKSDKKSCTACSAPTNDCTKTVSSVALFEYKF